MPPRWGTRFTLSEPRDPSTWPTTFPLYVPKNPESEIRSTRGQHEDVRSPRPASVWSSMLIAKYGAPGEKIPATYKEAYEVIQKYGRGVFGAPG